MHVKKDAKNEAQSSNQVGTNVFYPSLPLLPSYQLEENIVIEREKSLHEFIDIYNGKILTLKCLLVNILNLKS